MSTPRRPDALAAAFAAAFAAASDEAAGRAGGEARPRTLAYAERVLAARRRGLKAERCPPAVLQRVARLPVARAVRGVIGLLRLVFDAWREVSPASRGSATARLLRYEAPGLVLDLKLDRVRGGRLRLDLACEGERPRALRLCTSPPVRWQGLKLDAHGGAVVPLAAPVRKVLIEVRRASGEVLRTAPLPLEPAPG